MWIHTGIIYFMDLCLVLCFWRVIGVSKWIFVILSKYQPPKHTFSHMYPSQQKTHGRWIIFNVHTMAELSTLLQDRIWLDIQVSTCSSAVWTKQIAPRKHNWDAGSFLTAKILMHVQWLSHDVYLQFLQLWRLL